VDGADDVVERVAGEHLAVERLVPGLVVRLQAQQHPDPPLVLLAQEEDFLDIAFEGAAGHRRVGQGVVAVDPVDRRVVGYSDFLQAEGDAGPDVFFDPPLRVTAAVVMGVIVDADLILHTQCYNRNVSQAVVGEVSWERMIRAVEKVRERLMRAAAALEQSGVPYAVAGGNAVAAWVSRVDEAAVRNTRDVDLVLSRADFDAACRALETAGFVHRHALGLDMFLDGPQAKARDAVHIVFAGEKVRPDYLLPAPDVSEAERTASFRLLTLEALVRMKLTSFRDKDRMHLRDLMDVGLIDETWCGRVPAELAARLRTLLDDPDG
jgi:hypothetical protein